MTNLVLLAGIPGSGKTTWATTFFDLHYAIVSSDVIRKRLGGSLRAAHEQQVSPWDVFYEEIESRLKHNVDTIADATFLTRRHRHRARAIADQTGAALHIVLFKNWYAASERNSARDPDAKVPDSVMSSMRALFWDSLSELQDETYATRTVIEAFD